MGFPTEPGLGPPPVGARRGPGFAPPEPAVVLPLGGPPLVECPPGTARSPTASRVVTLSGRYSLRRATRRDVRRATLREPIMSTPPRAMPLPYRRAAAMGSDSSPIQPGGLHSRRGSPSVPRDGSSPTMGDPSPRRRGGTEVESGRAAQPPRLGDSRSRTPASSYRRARPSVPSLCPCRPLRRPSCRPWRAPSRPGSPRSRRRRPPLPRSRAGARPRCPS